MSFAPAPFHSGCDLQDLEFDGVTPEDKVRPGDLMPVKGIGDHHNFWQQGMVVALLPNQKIQILVDAKSISELVYKQPKQEGQEGS